jgi:hypothetical protein
MTTRSEKGNVLRMVRKVQPQSTGLSTEGARRMIEIAIPDAKLRRLALRLADAAGSAVGETVGAVFMAKSAGIVQAQKHGAVGDPGGAEGRRRRAIEALEPAVEAAIATLYRAGDAALRSALQEVLPQLRTAARHASRSRKAGRPRLGKGRAWYVQRLRDLGATDRQAEQIVSAVVGMPAQNIPEPPLE